MRSNNANRESLEISIAVLEQAQYALSFSSGLVATVTILQGLAYNGLVVSIADLCCGTHRYLTQFAGSHDVSVKFTATIEQDLSGLIQDNTKLIWIETPSNPLLSLVDTRTVADLAYDNGVLIAVVNTMLLPYLHIH